MVSLPTPISADIFGYNSPRLSPFSASPSCFKIQPLRHHTHPAIDPPPRQPLTQLHLAHRRPHMRRHPPRQHLVERREALHDAPARHGLDAGEREISAPRNGRPGSSDNEKIRRTRERSPTTSKLIQWSQSTSSTFPVPGPCTWPRRPRIRLPTYDCSSWLLLAQGLVGEGVGEQAADTGEVRVVGFDAGEGVEGFGEGLVAGRCA